MQRFLIQCSVLHFLNPSFRLSCNWLILRPHVGQVLAPYVSPSSTIVLPLSCPKRKRDKERNTQTQTKKARHITSGIRKGSVCSVTHCRSGKNPCSNNMATKFASSSPLTAMSACFFFASPWLSAGVGGFRHVCGLRKPSESSQRLQVPSHSPCPSFQQTRARHSRCLSRTFLVDTRAPSRIRLRGG